MKEPKLNFGRSMMALISLSTIATSGAHHPGDETISLQEWENNSSELADLVKNLAGYYVLPGEAEIVYLPYIRTRADKYSRPSVGRNSLRFPSGSRSFIGNMFSAVGQTTSGILGGTQQLIRGNVVGGVHTALKGIRGGVTSVGSAIKSVAKTFTRTTIKIGKFVILSPLRGLERTVRGTGDLVHMVGGSLASAVNALPGAVFNRDVKAVTFDDNQTVFSFSSALTAIVNPVKNSVFAIINTTTGIVSAANAMVIYQTTNVVTAMLGPIIKTLGFSCFQMPSQSVEVNQVVIDKLEMEAGEVCGLANIVAQNNVTITHDDETFLVVRIPLTLKHVRAHFTNVSVLGFFGPMLDNANLDIIVDDFHFHGDVKFRRWTILKFVTIHMRAAELKGFRLEFKNTKEKSSTMSILEGLSAVFEELLKNQINSAFEKMELDLSNAILGEE